MHRGGPQAICEINRSTTIRATSTGGVGLARIFSCQLAHPVFVVGCKLKIFTISIIFSSPKN